MSENLDAAHVNLIEARALVAQYPPADPSDRIVGLYLDSIASSLLALASTPLAIVGEVIESTPTKGVSTVAAEDKPGGRRKGRGAVAPLDEAPATPDGTVPKAPAAEADDDEPEGHAVGTDLPGVAADDFDPYDLDAKDKPPASPVRAPNAKKPKPRSSSRAAVLDDDEPAAEPEIEKLAEKAKKKGKKKGKGKK